MVKKNKNGDHQTPELCNRGLPAAGLLSCCPDCFPLASGCEVTALCSGRSCAMPTEKLLVFSLSLPLEQKRNVMPDQPLSLVIFYLDLPLAIGGGQCTYP